MRTQCPRPCTATPCLLICSAEEWSCHHGPQADSNHCFSQEVGRAWQGLGCGGSLPWSHTLYLHFLSALRSHQTLLNGLWPSIGAVSLGSSVSELSGQGTVPSPCSHLSRQRGTWAPRPGPSARMHSRPLRGQQASLSGGLECFSLITSVLTSVGVLSYKPAFHTKAAHIQISHFSPPLHLVQQGVEGSCPEQMGTLASSWTPGLQSSLLWQWVEFAAAGPALSLDMVVNE